MQFQTNWYNESKLCQTDPNFWAGFERRAIMIYMIELIKDKPTRQTSLI